MITLIEFIFSFRASFDLALLKFVQNIFYIGSELLQFHCKVKFANIGGQAYPGAEMCCILEPLPGSLSSFLFILIPVCPGIQETRTMLLLQIVKVFLSYK